MSHQLVRHRISSYSQESQRFCDYGKKGFKFIVPPKILNAEPYLYNAWLEDTINDYKVYLALREAKIPAEDARSKLPNATKTEVVTTNTRRDPGNYFVLLQIEHSQCGLLKISGNICLNSSSAPPIVALICHWAFLLRGRWLKTWSQIPIIIPMGSIDYIEIWLMK